MLAKVLMCPYFPENFKPNEENKHLKKRIQFYWKYDNKHEFFFFLYVKDIRFYVPV